MAIISLASSKGGVGKSTLSILIGAELAGYGYRVSVLDCDINQHASTFGEKCSIERFSVPASLAGCGGKVGRRHR